MRGGEREGNEEARGMKKERGWGREKEGIGRNGREREGETTSLTCFMMLLGH